MFFIYLCTYTQIFSVYVHLTNYYKFIDRALMYSALPAIHILRKVISAFNIKSESGQISPHGPGYTIRINMSSRILYCSLKPLTNYKTMLMTN